MFMQSLEQQDLMERENIHAIIGAAAITGAAGPDGKGKGKLIVHAITGAAGPDGEKEISWSYLKVILVLLIFFIRSRLSPSLPASSAPTSIAAACRSPRREAGCW